MWFRSQGKGAIFKSGLALVCAATLVVPPNVFADPITFVYNGGGTPGSPTSYSDPTAWTCSPSCTPGQYPDNFLTGGSVDAIINSGQPDNVLLDTPSVITSLRLGGSGAPATSTLTVNNGTSLSLGTPFDGRQNVLTVGNGGVLNVSDAGSSVTLNLTGGANFPIGSAIVQSGGQISVDNQSLLAIANGNNGLSRLTNDGTVNLQNGSTLLLLDQGNPSADGKGATFAIGGSGSINLNNGGIAGLYGDESLTNGPNHTIAGNGVIATGSFSNLGTLQASNGILQTLTLDNLNASTGTLAGGSYVADDGAMLLLNPLGSGTIQSIGQNTSVAVHGSGVISGDGVTNALTGLSNVGGSLTLDGQSLTPTGSSFGTSTTFQISPEAGPSYQSGSVSLQNGAILDLTSTQWQNESGGTLQNGNYQILSGSTFKYSGNDINSIDSSASLTLDGNPSFVNTNSSNPNPLSNTLSYVSGSLTLQNNASLTAGAPSFQADNYYGGGNVSVLNGSTLDLSSSSWYNEDGGTLYYGNFEIGKDSKIIYNGDDISAIDSSASLTLDNNGQLTNVGAGANPGGLGATLTDVYGSLTLNNASLTSTASSFQADAGSISLNNSSLDLSATTWGNLQYQSDLGANWLMNGTFNISNGSVLTYNGQDINGIENASLTVDGHGSIVNTNDAPGADPLSGLGYIGGSLTLKNYDLTPAVSSFTVNQGSLTLLNSNLDLSGTTWTNETGGTLHDGSFEIGAGSTLKYNGDDISTIDGTASLTLDGNGQLINVNAGANPGGLGATLTTVNGTLALDQGASLTLSNSSGSFTVGSNGSVSVDHGSTLDVSQLNFTNIDNTGQLGSGFFAVGDQSTLRYSGADLTTIGVNATLGLSGSGLVVNANGGDHDAVSNSLATVNGELVLDQGATLILSQQFTNNGTVELSGGSNLLVGPHGSSPVNFTNNWDGTNVGDCGCEGAIFGLLNSSSTVTGNLYNTSSALTQYEQYSSQVGLIGQSSLTVNGGFINDSSNGAGSSALTLDFGSTATVNGLLSNLGGSTVDLDFYSTEIPGTPGGSTLNANGGFLNSNSSVYLENGSTLNVSMPSQSLPTAAGPQTWAFQNASDDIASSENEALLQVGNPQFAPAYESQFNSSFNEGPGQAAPSVMNVTGGLLNSAVSTNDGAPWSFVNVDGGSTLNADTVSNVASVSGGTGLGSPEAKISVLNGSTMNVTGLLSNSADAAGGYAEAEVKVSGGSTLNAGSVLNQVTSSLGGDAEARIKVDGGIMNVGTTFTNTGGSVSVYNGGLLSIGTLAPGEGDNPPVATGVLTNTGRITTGWNGSTENTINVTGDIFNTSPGVINLKGNFDSMTATGQFTNSGTVSLSGAVQMVSAANITNQSGGVITVQGDSSTVAAVGTWSSDGQTQTSLGTFSNAGSVTIGQGAGVQADTFTQTGGQTAVEAGGSLTATNVNIDGGILSGGGTIYGDVKVDGGTLAPGDPQTIDIVGNYEQTLLGVLDLDFADGSNYDSVNVESDATHNGDVMLGGTLELTLENGFGAGVNIGDMFTILTWSGQLLPNVDDNNATNFDFLNLGTFNNGNQLLTFREVLGDNQLDLQVIDASVATPEPSTVAMMFGVLLLAGGVVWIRRRRAQRTVEAME